MIYNIVLDAGVQQSEKSVIIMTFLIIYQSVLSKSFLVLLYSTGWQQRSTAYSTSNGKQFYLLLFYQYFLSKPFAYLFTALNNHLFTQSTIVLYSYYVPGPGLNTRQTSVSKAGGPCPRAFRVWW